MHRNVPSQLIYPIRGMYLEAIDRATERISITQPYFIPDRVMVRALLAAARRGVDVRVLVPAASNHVITDWLSRGFYSAFLRGGVTIWRFEGAMIHAKTMTIDGRWSTIGTANIDRLSLTGNYEINVELFDRGVAEHLERVFATDLTNATQLTPAEWARRGSSRRSPSNCSPLCDHSRHACFRARRSSEAEVPRPASAGGAFDPGRQCGRRFR